MNEGVNPSGERCSEGSGWKDNCYHRGGEVEYEGRDTPNEDDIPNHAMYNPHPLDEANEEEEY